jgi:hypothetical protein
MAPGATWLMNACWAEVPGTCVASADGAFLVYDGADGVELRAAWAAGACSPGMTAVPTPRPSRDAVPGRRSAPGRGPFSRGVARPRRGPRLRSRSRLGSLPRLGSLASLRTLPGLGPRLRRRTFPSLRSLPGLGSLPGLSTLPGLGSVILPGSRLPGSRRGGPVARPGRGAAAGPAGEVGHRARHRHHALRAEASRPACCAHHPGRTFPSRRTMALGCASPASFPRRAAGDGRERRPRHGCAARTRLALTQEPGRHGLSRTAPRCRVSRGCRTACGCRSARRTTLLAHRAQQLAIVDEAVHALCGQRAGERVRVDREVRRGVPADRAEGSG